VINGDGDSGGGGEAVVVFSGEAELPWLRLLKPGFRHCFVLVDGGGGTWVSVDPLSHRTEVRALESAKDGRWTADGLAAWFRSRGFRAVPCRVTPAPRTSAPWFPYTCVEAVKRVIGIHDRRLWTPWRLYRYLIKNT